MKNNKREIIFLRFSFYLSFVFLVCCFLVLIHFLPQFNFKINTAQKPQSIKIVRVIDGDTIVTENNQKIRLIGIDTPEVNNNNNSQKCLGDIATNKMKELVEGKDVILEKDVSDIDKYGRLLRYIWVDNTLINKTLVQEGYAKVDTVKPDIKYLQVFSVAQTQAQNRKVGLWNEFNCTNLKQNLNDKINREDTHQ